MELHGDYLKFGLFNRKGRQVVARCAKGFEGLKFFLTIDYTDFYGFVFTMH